MNHRDRDADRALTLVELEEQRAVVLDACEEIVRRWAQDKTLYPDTRAMIERSTDPLDFGRQFAALFGVGPLRRNGATCEGCGDTIESAHRHDYVTCTCGNVSVDGGTWYARRSMKGTAPFGIVIAEWPWVEEEL